MTVLSPALFAALAQAPGVTESVAGRLEIGPPEVNSLLETLPIGDALEPLEFERGVREGGMGVPLLTEYELFALAGEVEKESEPAGIWRGWEFWRADDSQYAMFPADNEPQRYVSTTLLVPSNRSVEIQRVDLARIGHGVEVEDATRSVPPQPCVLKGEEETPGAPYRGRCANKGCGGGCTPLIFVAPDDGLYRLLGCEC